MSKRSRGKFTPAARRAAIEVRAARAKQRAVTRCPLVKAPQAAGVTSLNGIAAALIERNVPTPAGRGHWHAMQVARVLKRLAG
jgi:hypothetical protein